MKGLQGEGANIGCTNQLSVRFIPSEPSWYLHFFWPQYWLAEVFVQVNLRVILIWLLFSNVLNDKKKDLQTVFLYDQTIIQSISHRLLSQLRPLLAILMCIKSIRPSRRHIQYSIDGWASSIPTLHDKRFSTVLPSQHIMIAYSDSLFRSDFE